VIDTVPSVNARNGLLTAGTVKVDPSVQRYLGLFALPNGAVQGDTGLYTFGSKALTPENAGFSLEGLTAPPDFSWAVS
jgi:hypothetical protein